MRHENDNYGLSIARVLNNSKVIHKGKPSYAKKRMPEPKTSDKTPFSSLSETMRASVINSIAQAQQLENQETAQGIIASYHNRYEGIVLPEVTKPETSTSKRIPAEVLTEIRPPSKKIFLSALPDIEPKSRISDFHSAIQDDDKAYVTLYLKSYEGIGECCHDKLSPLLKAILGYNVSAVESLILHNVDVNKADERGNTPLDIARRVAPLPTVGEKIINLLLEAGAIDYETVTEREAPSVEEMIQALTQFIANPPAQLSTKEYRLASCTHITQGNVLRNIYLHICENDTEELEEYTRKWDFRRINFTDKNLLEQLVQ